MSFDDFVEGLGKLNGVVFELIFVCYNGDFIDMGFIVFVCS